MFFCGIFQPSVFVRGAFLAALPHYPETRRHHPAQPLVAAVLVIPPMPEHAGVQHRQAQRRLDRCQAERLAGLFGQQGRHGHHHVGAADDVGHGGEVGHLEVDRARNTGLFQPRVDLVIGTFA